MRYPRSIYPVFFGFATVFLSFLVLTFSTPPPLNADSLSLETLPKFAKLAVGSEHVCAVTEAGGVMCWGANYRGQLGDGLAVFTNTYRSTPAYVIGLSAVVTDIAAGGSNSCAILVDGRVQCWGNEGFEKIGTPFEVTGLDEAAISIAANDYGACAVLVGGSVKCWSENRQPRAIKNIYNAQSISMGITHICILLKDGNVTCYGSNVFGQIGDGTVTEFGDGAYYYEPITNVVKLNGRAVEISAGWAHTCARLNDGSATCWGNNAYGQLGSNVTSHSGVPVLIPEVGVKVISIMAASARTCAILDSGETKCWGHNNTGQLGDGSTDSRNTPELVLKLPLGDVKIIDGGSYGTTSCALLQNGSIKCWGANGMGQLGDGSAPPFNSLVQVHGLQTDLNDIVVWNQETCTTSTSGKVVCWGDSYGQEPILIESLNDVKQIIHGGSKQCILTTSNSLKCWPHYWDPATSMIEVEGLAGKIAAVAGGSSHFCAITTDGGAKCWGSNYEGQLGIGTFDEHKQPVDVSGLTSNVVAIAVGGLHSCALTSAGAVKCWGNNGHGQLGDGTTTNRLLPTNVNGLQSGVIGIASALGAVHTCALLVDRTVKCWGLNYDGQLGDGTHGMSESKSTPVAVVGLDSVDHIIARSNYNCAKLTSGQIKCWGHAFTQLNAIGNEMQLTAFNFAIDGENIQTIVGNNGHHCVFTLAKRVICWGNNHVGQLGNGTAWRTTPGFISLSSPTPTPIGQATATRRPTKTPMITPTPTATTTLMPTLEFAATSTSTPTLTDTTIPTSSPIATPNTTATPVALFTRQPNAESTPTATVTTVAKSSNDAVYLPLVSR